LKGFDRVKYADAGGKLSTEKRKKTLLTYSSWGEGPDSGAILPKRGGNKEYSRLKVEGERTRRKEL